MIRPEQWRSKDEYKRDTQRELEEAHSDAFKTVCDVIEKSIIEEHEVMKLKDLQEIYVESLNHSKFANIDYRCEKLRNRIEKHPILSVNVSFLKIERGKHHQLLLIYNSKMSISQAVSKSYNLGAKDIHMEVADDLRKSVITEFKDSEKLPWPPTDDFLNKKDCIPSDLNDFLSQLLTGRTDKTSEKKD